MALTTSSIFPVYLAETKSLIEASTEPQVGYGDEVDILVIGYFDDHGHN